VLRPAGGRLTVPGWHSFPIWQGRPPGFGGISDRRLRAGSGPGLPAPEAV